MKPLRTSQHAHHVSARGFAHTRPHLPRIGREGSHVMLPLVVLSLMALGLYYGVSHFDFSELGRSALFYVVMAVVAIGIAGLFGTVGAWLHAGDEREEKGFCFVGALIGAVVFYWALFS